MEENREAHHSGRELAPLKTFMRPKHRTGQHQFQKQLVPVYAHNITSAKKEGLTQR